MRLDRRRRKPSIKSFAVKQSVSINGHHSSVSIEGAFWNALKEIAVGQNISINALISKSTVRVRPSTYRRPSVCMLSNIIAAISEAILTTPLARADEVIE
jgi:predicted DNA-binding ribbon-helix-helix protein